ncbi:Nup85p SCDLUD_003392 [Saccharomycodes ludwigii]|uniref:Nup85p n=1 Tax=Saccharomycodes ludwigii TaxID=36035 RepID=UPI001E83B8DB|nr:hypothetical protein SCDLUD_003392 [Saccharomycodes ludwigii]KAH3900413.1 hypothetical protein SCDLUD_003392 [Saccharomycodes ludwigii]
MNSGTNTTNMNDAMKSTKNLLLSTTALDFLNDIENKNQNNYEDGMIDNTVNATNSLVSQSFNGVYKKFKFNPICESGVSYFNKNKDTSPPLYFWDTQLEEGLNDTSGSNTMTTNNVIISDVVDVDYISKLFELYYDLTPEHRHDSGKLTTYGIINKQEVVEHFELVDLCFEDLSNELDIYLNKKQQQQHDSAVVISLQELLNIVNCLKTFQFYCIKNGPDEYLDSNFFSNLKEWVNKCDGEPDINDVENFMANSVDNVEIFYKLVIRFVLRGLFKQAINLLITWRDTTACKYINNEQHYEAIIQLLENYPFDNEQHFREWKNYTAELTTMVNSTGSDSRDTGDKELQQYWFNKLVYVLNGSKHEIATLSDKWYECLSGLFFFYIPTMKLLPEYLQISLQNKSTTGIWEDCCVDVLCNRLLNILPVLESLNQPTAAFIAGLLESRGLIPTPVDVVGTSDVFKPSLASYMLYQLSLKIVTPTSTSIILAGDNNDCVLYKRLFSISFGILNVSGYHPYIRETISELLLHYPIINNDDFEYCLTVAAKWKLPNTLSKLYERLAMKMITEEKNLLEGLLYLSKVIETTKDFKSVSYVEKKITAYSLALVRDKLSGCGNASIRSNLLLVDEVIKKQEDNNTDVVLPKILKQSLSPYAVLLKCYAFNDTGKFSKLVSAVCTLLEFKYLNQDCKVMILYKFIWPYLTSNRSGGMKNVDVPLLLRLIKTIQDIKEDCNAKDDGHTFFIEIQNEFPDRRGFLIELKKLLNTVFCRRSSLYV